MTASLGSPAGAPDPSSAGRLDSQVLHAIQEPIAFVKLSKTDKTFPVTTVIETYLFEADF
jgi:hypothetical protein